MKKNEYVTINTIVVRDSLNWEYIPVQIVAIKIKNGKEIEFYSSMINPMCNPENIINLPKHLNTDVLSKAPSLHSVLYEIDKFAKGCTIEMDEISKSAIKFI